MGVNENIYSMDNQGKYDFRVKKETSIKMIECHFEEFESDKTTGEYF